MDIHNLRTGESMIKLPRSSSAALGIQGEKLEEFATKDFIEYSGLKKWIYNQLFKIR